MKIHGTPLRISDAEREHITDLVIRWSESLIPPPLLLSGPPDPIYSQWDGDANTEAIAGLQTILLEVKMSESTTEKLYGKFRTLGGYSLPRLGLTAGLINALPQRFDDIVSPMRMGLASDDPRLAKDAVRGLWFWLYNAANSNVGLQAPPGDLVREIGTIIATRRKASLGEALQIAKWIFSEGEAAQREIIGDLVAQGLGYLTEELRYDRNHDLDVDISLLRWGCTHLALAMAGCDFDTNPAITRWVETAKNDPLPEVRYAKGPTSSDQLEHRATTSDESDSRTE